MATKSFLTCLNLQILRQKIFIAIYTTPCANMSVSVYPVSSFREEMRFVILHHKCSEFYWNEQLFSLQFIHNAKVQKQDIPTTFGGVGMSCLFQTFTTSRKPLAEWNLSLFHNHHYRIGIIRQAFKWSQCSDEDCLFHIYNHLLFIIFSMPCLRRGRKQSSPLSLVGVVGMKGNKFKKLMQ